MASKNFLIKCYTYFFQLSFRTHLFISCLIRLFFIFYGELHDAHSEVPFTDIDYKVVTDGARKMLEGDSPFRRHTYRYSPILALLLEPNILIHPIIGKIIFSAFDIFVAILIRANVLANLKAQQRSRKSDEPDKTETIEKKISIQVNDELQKIASYSTYFWLYNPITCIISTRGNGDSFSSFFVIMTLQFLAQADAANKRRDIKTWIYRAGLSHGFSIHLRLYPIIFSLAYLLSLKNQRKSKSAFQFFKEVITLSDGQKYFILGSAIGFFVTSGLCYYFYGMEYIKEAYIYHLVRKDVRHNFSYYFLVQYLGTNYNLSDIVELITKFLLKSPLAILLCYLSFNFGQNRQTLPFCLFSLTFVFVTFNPVVTSQYFVWYLALLPLCMHNLHSISKIKALTYFGAWILAQALWLLPAFLLEFKTWNTFYWIGFQGALFFLYNMVLLTHLITHYDCESFKTLCNKLQ